MTTQERSEIKDLNQLKDEPVIPIKERQCMSRTLSKVSKVALMYNKISRGLMFEDNISYDISTSVVSVFLFLV